MLDENGEARDGAQFCTTQNSFPSGSAMTTWSASGGYCQGTRRPPSASMAINRAAGSRLASSAMPVNVVDGSGCAPTIPAATMLQRMREVYNASGIDVERVVLFVWALGGALAAFGGVLYGLSAQVSWQMGFQLLLLMFAGVILGGLGTAFGPFTRSVSFSGMTGYWCVR